MSREHDYLCVRKSQLPMPIVIVGDDGELAVQELAPAGKKKLGARVGAATESVRQAVLRKLGRK